MWPGSLDFSWGFLGGGKLLERLDQFYVNDWATGKGGQSGILAGRALSNHSLAFLAFDAVSRSLAPCSCHISDSIYA